MVWFLSLLTLHLWVVLTCPVDVWYSRQSYILASLSHILFFGQKIRTRRVSTSCAKFSAPIFSSNHFIKSSFLYISSGPSVFQWILSGKKSVCWCSWWSCISPSISIYAHGSQKLFSGLHSWDEIVFVVNIGVDAYTPADILARSKNRTTLINVIKNIAFIILKKEKTQ